jgi:hypothetical protein
MKTRWIPVTERLPELIMGHSGDDVLCWTKDGPVIGRYANFHFTGLKWIETTNDEEIHPTHWQPIEPPG